MYLLVNIVSEQFGSVRYRECEVVSDLKSVTHILVFIKDGVWQSEHELIPHVNLKEISKLQNSA